MIAKETPPCFYIALKLQEISLKALKLCFKRPFKKRLKLCYNFKKGVKMLNLSIFFIILSISSFFILILFFMKKMEKALDEK